MHKCEKVYWILMPAVKRELAKILVKKYKIKAKDAAEMLNVTKAAVSQYLQKKRGRKKLSKDAKKILDNAAKNLIKSAKREREGILNKTLCKICKEVFR